MPRRSNPCQCCPCEIVPIFRCEQLAADANLTYEAWNAKTLPLVGCDALPRARTIDPVKFWGQRASPLSAVLPLSRSSGGNMVLDLGARQIALPGVVQYLSKRTADVNAAGFNSGPGRTIDLVANKEAPLPSVDERNQLLSVRLFGDALQAGLRTELLLHLIEPDAINYDNPASRPRPGLLTIVYYGPSVSGDSAVGFLLTPAPDIYQVFLQNGGSNVAGAYTAVEDQQTWNGPYKAVYGAWYDALPRQAYHTKRTIELGSLRRLSQSFSGPATSHSLSVMVAQHQTEPLQRIATVAANVSAGLSGGGFFGHSFNPGQIIYDPGKGSSGYTRAAILGISGDTEYGITIYRDGTEVAKIAKDDQAGFQTHTAAEGSYLFVGTYGGNVKNPAPATAIGQFARQQTAKPNLLHTFHSVVVDRTPPVVAVRQINDFFVDDETDVYPQSFPVYPFGTCGQPWFTSDGRRPLGDFNLSGIQLNATYPAGTHTAAPSNNFRETLRDNAGNVPATVGSIEFTIHEVPGSGKVGANATWKLPDNVSVQLQCLDPRTGFQRTTFYDIESLTYPGPVSAVRLRFNRRVRSPKRSTATKAVTLSGKDNNGDISATVQSLQVADKSRTEYVALLPSGPQSPNSLWTLTFQPTEDFIVIPDGVNDLAFESRPSFPAVGEPLTIYHDKATGDDYEYIDGGYRKLIDGELPADAEGTGNRCLLACRAQWVIEEAKTPGRELIDTGRGGPMDLLPVPTLTDTITIPDDPVQAAKTTIASTNDIYLPPSCGTFTDDERSTFVAGVPAEMDSPSTATASWFNLGTTIYPSAAAAVPSCAALSLPQRHASLLFGKDDISGLRFTFKPRQLTARTVEFASAQPLYGDYWAPPFQVFWFNTRRKLGTPRDEWYGSWPVADVSSGLVPWFLRSPMDLTKTLGNDITTQNVWSCVNESPSGTIAVGYRRDVNVNPDPNGAAVFQSQVFSFGTITPRLLQSQVVARRQAVTYGGLLTAAVSTLRLDFTARVACEYSFTTTDNNPPVVDNKARSGVWHSHASTGATIYLTKQEEQELANGQTITVYDGGTFGILQANASLGMNVFSDFNGTWESGWEIKTI
jgi:hypothetical protein